MAAVGDIVEATPGAYYMDTMMIRRISRWRGGNVPTPTAEYFDEDDKPSKPKRERATRATNAKVAPSTPNAPRAEGTKLSSADRRKLRAAGLRAPYSAEDIARVLA